MSPKARPEFGSITKRVVDCRVCKACGYLVSETGLCGDECAHDGEHHKDGGTYFIARYESTHKFMGDFETTGEKYNGKDSN